MAKDKKLPVFAAIPGFGGKFAAWIKAVVFISLGLAYLFWTVDVIPDVLGPVVGRIDDAIIFVAAAWAIRGAINTILEKKGAFLGGGK